MFALSDVALNHVRVPVILANNLHPSYPKKTQLLEHQKCTYYFHPNLDLDGQWNTLTFSKVGGGCIEHIFNQNHCHGLLKHQGIYIYNQLRQAQKN